MTDPEDPRAQYRQLPERVLPDDVVETTDVRPVEADPEPQPAWQPPYLGG